MIIEPNAKTLYDPAILERFPEFEVINFTDDVLDTQSDMFLINKGTFSSMQ